MAKSAFHTASVPTLGPMDSTRRTVGVLGIDSVSVRKKEVRVSGLSKTVGILKRIVLSAPNVCKDAPGDIVLTFSRKTERLGGLSKSTSMIVPPLKSMP